MKIIIFYAIVLGLEIAYSDYWCEDSVMISDTAGEQPDITLESCQQRCLGEASCNFMFFGIEAYSCVEDFRDRCLQHGIKANRCALFKTCDKLKEYSGGKTSIYRLIKGKKNNIELKMFSKKIKFYCWH